MRHLSKAGFLVTKYGKSSKSVLQASSEIKHAEFGNI